MLAPFCEAFLDVFFLHFAIILLLSLQLPTLSACICSPSCACLELHRDRFAPVQQGGLIGEGEQPALMAASSSTALPPVSSSSLSLGGGGSTMINTTPALALAVASPKKIHNSSGSGSSSAVLAPSSSHANNNDYSQAGGGFLAPPQSSQVDRADLSSTVVVASGGLELSALANADNHRSVSKNGNYQPVSAARQVGANSQPAEEDAASGSSSFLSPSIHPDLSSSSPPAPVLALAPAAASSVLAPSPRQESFEHTKTSMNLLMDHKLELELKGVPPTVAIVTANTLVGYATAKLLHHNKRVQVRVVVPAESKRYSFRFVLCCKFSSSPFVSPVVPSCSSWGTRAFRHDSRRLLVGCWPQYHSRLGLCRFRQEGDRVLVPGERDRSLAFFGSQMGV